MKDDTVKDHLATFHRLDFEAYNGRDWDLFAQLHTDDVIVEMAGYRTEGITPHVEAVKAMIAEDPESRALEHTIAFGGDDWTCGVSKSQNGDGTVGTVVTIARWRDGRIAEEYLFFA